ncbi:matrixin family metalloprotease [Lentilactobacillus sunkii]|uniref:Uncharacterized protein n=1 Tax=Lentilactobacillus sunkii DSM 19904 TaxID=1423808 RepID=A0A0R1L119_9LACO|nr:matrixin family metalloprotease [Lentilactobacillus sunkii]KRK89542.1 hypothetical protein FD17_GL001129 [Lentilactobacillus sunkii DSM 19904]
MKKSIIAVAMAVTLFSGATFPTVAQPVTVTAKTHSIKKAKVVKYYHHHYQNLKLKKGYLYQTKTLTRKIHKAKTYQNRTFKSRTQVKLKKANGKNALYYFVYSGKIKGYIWSGYIKHSKVKTTTSQKPATPTQSNNNSGNSTNADAKPSITKDQLMTLINQSPDLDPTGQLLSLTNADYVAYADVLWKNYNLSGFINDADNFPHDQQNITVADSVLTPYVKVAIDKWNAALGQTVFTMDSSKPAQLTVDFGSLTNADGQFGGSTIDIDQAAFNDSETHHHDGTDSAQQQAAANFKALEAQRQQNIANYQQQKQAIKDKYQQLLNQLPDAAGTQTGMAEREQLGKQRQAELTAAMRNYNQVNDQINQQEAMADESDSNYKNNPMDPSRAATDYWSGVLVHEFGHDLGLDHTPYLSDIMGAYWYTATEDGLPQEYYKYSWDREKDDTTNHDSGVNTVTLSQRDIDRAKLTHAMKAW